MPKIDDVAWLIECIGNKNYTQARAAAKTMADTERKMGRESGAKRLEYSLRNWTDKQLTELPHNIQTLVWPEEPRFSFGDLHLEGTVVNAVQSFFLERVNLQMLRDAGLTLRNKILLAGPPGNGKTSLAEAIAKELELPFISIKLHETIEGHMGGTSSRLGKIFEYAQFNNCLIFLDELDCLGSQRTVRADDGADKERNSIVNTLLTSLDHISDGSIIVGATNLPEAIDGALERRFNLKLWLDYPSDEEIMLYIGTYQLKHGLRFPEFADLSGKPWSRIAEFCVNQHRSIILGEENTCYDEWVGRIMQSTSC